MQCCYNLLPIAISEIITEGRGKTIKKDYENMHLKNLEAWFVFRNSLQLQHRTDEPTVHISHVMLLLQDSPVQQTDPL